LSVQEEQAGDPLRYAPPHCAMPCDASQPGQRSVAGGLQGYTTPDPSLLVQYPVSGHARAPPTHTAPTGHSLQESPEPAGREAEI